MDEPSSSTTPAGPSQSTSPRGADGRIGPYGKEVRGRRVRVWWDGDEAWYCGVVADFSEARDGEHLVRYDDGDTKWDRLDEMEAQGLLTWPSAEPETSSGGKKRKRAACYSTCA